MFSKGVHKRMGITFLFILVLFIIIILKVLYIQMIDYKKLNKLANNLWSRNLPIEADRGKILDRNGVVLADNITTTALVLVPNQIEDKDSVSQALADILGVTKKEMDTHVYKKTSIEKVHPEGRRLSYETAEKISSLNYDGVYLLKESKRYYPNGDVLSHVLGYVGIDNQGLSGLELQYNDYLTGKNGAIKYFSDGKGNKLNKSEIYEMPQSGMDIYLNIDIEIQLAIEREMDNTIMKYNPEQMIVVAMDPNTFEILGMSSRPTFDPSNYSNYDIETINRNLPIWSTYEPGSTFKIITLAASLEEKTVDLVNEIFYDGGSVNVEGSRIKCWKHGGHGMQTFLQVVENSCNPGFVEMGQRLGKNKLFKYINKFGFGDKTGIDLNGESDGILFKLSNVGPVELATTSFGQGVSVTPIQQVAAVSAAINGGNLYTPYVVKNITEPETNTIIKTFKSKFKRRVISNETSELVRHTLESVAQNGSGRNAYIQDYRVGGKTGTAQKVKDGRYMVGNYILSFVGFLPADNPEIVLYVAVDNPKGVTQYGGVVAAPIAKSILEDVIEIMDIEKRDVDTDRTYEWYDKKYYEVPNVVGMNLKEAKSLLKNFTIDYSGNGDIVVEQSPSDGTKIQEGSKVRLMLGD
ncbi:MAG: stage V sporulation protein D [Bacilli bacterium]